MAIWRRSHAASLYDMHTFTGCFFGMFAQGGGTAWFDFFDYMPGDGWSLGRGFLTKGEILRMCEKS